MKKYVSHFTLLSITFIFCFAAKAQVPQGFNYQAIARNNAGEVMVNQDVGLEFAIHSDTPNGPISYSEMHFTTTNDRGLIKLIIGTGIPILGDISTVDWANSQHFLEVKLDPEGSSNFEFLGTSELYSVPYAMVANSVANDAVDDADSDPSNELQTLFLNADTLSLSNGNFVVIPTAVDTDDQTLSLQNDSLVIEGGNWVNLSMYMDNHDEQELSLVNDTLLIENGNWINLAPYLDNTDEQSLSLVGNELSISGGNSVIFTDNVDDADADPANEIQDISLSGNDLSISSGSTVDLSSLSGAMELSGTVLRDAGDNSVNDFVIGSTQLNNDADAAHFSRMFFDKSKSAFRAGYMSGAQWNEDSLGIGSFATGAGNLASGSYAVAMGSGNKAKGIFSTAFGFGTIANKNYSFAAGRECKVNETYGVAMGKSSEANGFASVALNNATIAAGNSSFAAGNQSQANGAYAIAMGNLSQANASNCVSLGSQNISSAAGSVVIGSNSVASGIEAMVFGKSAVATGSNSLAMGHNSFSTGNHAMAMGWNVSAPSLSETVFGLNNTDYVPASSNTWVATDRIFVVGNGTDVMNKNDAFVITKDGDAFLAGLLTQSSDRRLKKNIKPLQSSLEKILSLNGVTYNWNENTPRNTDDLQIGLIAQDVEKVFPNLVETQGNGYKSVNYISLIPVLIEAIKEQQEKIDSLEKAIELIKEEK